jgi:hypothetical protein
LYELEEMLRCLRYINTSRSKWGPPILPFQAFSNQRFIFNYSTTTNNTAEPNLNSKTENRTDDMSSLLATIENIFKEANAKDAENKKTSAVTAPEKEPADVSEISDNLEDTSDEAIEAEILELLEEMAPKKGSESSDSDDLRGINLLETMLERKTTPLPALSHFHLYPKQVRAWIIAAKTQGYYEEDGTWQSIRGLQALQEAWDLRPLVADVPSTVSLAPKRTDSDLEGHYRFGLVEEDVKECPPKLRDVLSMQHAPQAEVNQFRIDRAMKKWGKFDGDSGSTAVQGT